MAKGGGRSGAGRHKRDCDCAKCQTKQAAVGSRPTDANLARKLKAKIKAEARWLEILSSEIELMRKTGKTSPLKKTLIYLDDRDLGVPIHTVNHLHDKPIQVEATVKISEIIREVRERKEKYERGKHS